jgi:hypothetical protein
VGDRRQLQHDGDTAYVTDSVAVAHRTMVKPTWTVPGFCRKTMRHVASHAQCRFASTMRRSQEVLVNKQAVDVWEVGDEGVTRDGKEGKEEQRKTHGSGHKMIAHGPMTVAMPSPVVVL